MPDDCIFCKIAAKEIPVEPVYEDDEFIAVHDQHKEAPVHVLVLTKTHYPTILDIQDEGVMGRAMLAAMEVARRMNLAKDGFRTIINYGDDGGQSVYHVHIHVMGGRFLQWPPG